VPGMEHWTEYGMAKHPPMSGRRLVDPVPPPIQKINDERTSGMHLPLRGLTTDGELRAGLFNLAPTGVSTAPLVEAALAFLGSLTSTQREQVSFPLQHEGRRTWINVHMNFFRHGLMLEALSATQRSLAVELLRETLSARGFGQARDIMRLNELLGMLTGSPDEFGEWLYFISFFGTPNTAGEPWMWQFDGHHLCVNCTVVGDQMVMTPTFMGSEPCQVDSGPFAGTTVFVPEQQSGLELIRSLDAAQASTAILYPSIHPSDIPRELQHPYDGRMVAGAFRDNAVRPYEGLSSTDMTDAQRRLLRRVLATYVGWTRDGHSAVRMEEVDAHLDETYLAWMGSTGDGAFYYRVQSPVIIVEFDHHPGVAFDNKVPSRNHVHTIVRTPNGGDYGLDLLRQHHEQFDHSHGTHEPRHQASRPWGQAGGIG
jgi:Protein of unknown function (DUF3500)